MRGVRRTDTSSVIRIEVAGLIAMVGVAVAGPCVRSWAVAGLRLAGRTALGPLAVDGKARDNVDCPAAIAQ
eukprot:2351147-Pyramimonas_sp.AAC.1